MIKIDYKLMFDRLLEHMELLYEPQELCARLLYIGLNDENELHDLGFDDDIIKDAKNILKNWVGDKSE